MESPKFTYQPVEDDDNERWLNEGGHLAPADEVLADEEEVPLDLDDTTEN